MIWYDIWYDMIYDMIWYMIWYVIWLWYDMIWYMIRHDTTRHDMTYFFIYANRPLIITLWQFPPAIYILREVLHNRKSSPSLHTDLQVSHISEVYTGSIPEVSFCESPLNLSCRRRCIRKRRETCHMFHQNSTQHSVNRVYLLARNTWTRRKLLFNRRLMALLVFGSLAAIDRHQLTGSVEILAYWLDSTETAWWAEISGTFIGMQSFCLPSFAVFEHLYLRKCNPIIK